MTAHYTGYRYGTGTAADLATPHQHGDELRRSYDIETSDIARKPGAVSALEATHVGYTLYFTNTGPAFYLDTGRAGIVPDGTGRGHNAYAVVQQVQAAFRRAGIQLVKEPVITRPTPQWLRAPRMLDNACIIDEDQANGKTALTFRVALQDADKARIVAEQTDARLGGNRRLPSRPSRPFWDIGEAWKRINFGL